MTVDERPAGTSVGLSGFEPLLADALTLTLVRRGMRAAVVERDHRPDDDPDMLVAALDVNTMEGLEQLRVSFATVPIVAVVPSVSAPLRQVARRVDAVAVVSRQDGLGRLVEVLDLALGGATVVPPEDGEGDPLVDLTAREIDVLRMVASGSTNTEIGTALGISQHTARTHVQHLMAKLGVRNRLAAGAVARDAGLTSGRGS
jgi:DNA-binding NarL/FixJ family response regulator